MFALYWIAFAPARKLYRTLGVLFTHNNRDFGAISVTERGCAAPRQSLKWRVTYQKGVHTIPDSFCAGTKTIPVELLFTHIRTGISARFLERSEAVPRRSLKWSVTYRIVVHIHTSYIYLQPQIHVYGKVAIRQIQGDNFSYLEMSRNTSYA